jgi:hypothetical protein
VLDAGQQAGVVAATAFAVLAAIGVPAVRGERAFPAVGLRVAGLQESPDSLVAGRTTARAVEITNEGRVKDERASPSFSTSTRSSYATEIALLLVPKSMPYPRGTDADLTTGL